MVPRPNIDPCLRIRPANSSSSLEMDHKARSSPGLKVTIKNSGSDRSAPGVTIQNYSDSKEATRGVTSSFKPGTTNSKTALGGANHMGGSKAAHKINERFITDPGAAQRSEERKRSGDSSGGIVARRKLGTNQFALEERIKHPVLWIRFLDRDYCSPS